MVRDTGQDLEPGRGESGDCGRGQSRLAWTGEIAVAVVVLSGLAGVALWSGTALDATATQARLLYSDFAGTRQARDLEWQIQASRRQFLSTTPPAGDRAAEAALGKARFESAIAALHARQKALDEDAGRRRSAVEGGIENVVIADALFLPVALAGMVGLWLRRRRRNHALQVLSLRHRERGSASGWERERNGVLELIGTNQPLELICDAIVAIVESRHAHVSCGIAVVRKGSLRFFFFSDSATT